MRAYPLSRVGWKIVLAPVFFYLMVGTGALLLIYELEKLVYGLGHSVHAPGLSDRSATEWHTKDLRLVVAFPIVMPILAVWNGLLLLWAVYVLRDVEFLSSQPVSG